MMSFDEEYLSPHGECRHEIHRLEAQLKDQDAYIERLQQNVPDLLAALRGMLSATDHWNDWEPGAKERAEAAAAIARATTPAGH